MENIQNIKIEIKGAKHDRDACFALLSAACDLMERNGKDPLEMTMSFFKHYDDLKSMQDVKSFEIFNGGKK
jgi:hypothetical protein